MQPGSTARRALLSSLLALPALAACQQDGLQTGGGSGQAEQVLRIPVPAQRGSPTLVELEATLFRPAGDGPFPLVVMSHGQPAGTAQMRSVPRQRFPELSRVMMQEGYAVLLPMRRGYGNSGGEFRGGSGRCGSLAPLNNARFTAEDIEACRAWALANLPGLDARRVLLAGQSAGGYGSLYAASQVMSPVAGVINFAGGLRAGSTLTSAGTMQFCDGWQDVVTESFAAMGRGPAAAQLPTLWLYAANDNFFGFGLSRRFVEAYRQGGGQARYLELPIIGRDGHGFLQEPGSISHWGAPVRAFLAERRATPMA